jgi:hypothetical protein
LKNPCVEVCTMMKIISKYVEGNKKKTIIRKFSMRVRVTQ